MKQKDKGIIYKGPSLIDGSQIVVLATMGNKRIPNTKTGAMLQTYILVDNGKTPTENNRTGQDYAICGDCPHRGTARPDATSGTADNRACYVKLFHGPRSAYASYLNGGYENLTGHLKTSALGAGRMVRLGTYGDPAAVPSHIWHSLLWQAAGHTAYTHQSGIESADVRRDMMMISADNEAEARAAWRDGGRTFRIVSDYSQLVEGFEIPCPADTKGLSCLACGLCKGAANGGKSIAIAVHGAGAKHFKG